MNHQNLYGRSPLRAVDPIYQPGMGARQLTWYMHQQLQRPKDNNIEFLRNFVTEFFALNAKKRWCISLYGSSHQTSGVIPQTTRAPSPLLGNQFNKSALGIHGTVRYAISSQAVVLIYSWEFCARNHEERIPRRIIIPQIGRLGEAAQKYQAATQNTTSGIPMQELQSNCNTLLLIDKYMYFSRFVTSAHQLAKALEVPLVNDLGYPKRYVRCLQDLTKAMEKRRRRTATSATTAASD
ncbi:hypothetical protein RHMOL_Rhmol10G0192100 [Rhododendron molle]|nr:hypothetical protein RHMOL_Rhmol10G0192100 [Rhododendron molle]